MLESFLGQVRFLACCSIVSDLNDVIMHLQSIGCRVISDGGRRKVNSWVRREHNGTLNLIFYKCTLKVRA